MKFLHFVMSCLKVICINRFKSSSKLLACAQATNCQKNGLCNWLVVVTYRCYTDYKHAPDFAIIWLRVIVVTQLILTDRATRAPCVVNFRKKTQNAISDVYDTTKHTTNKVNILRKINIQFSCRQSNLR